MRPGKGSARPPGAEPPTAPANPPWRGSSASGPPHRRSPPAPRPRATGGPLDFTLPQSTDRNRRSRHSGTELSPSPRTVHTSHDPSPFRSRRRQPEWHRPIEGEAGPRRGGHDDGDGQAGTAGRSTPPSGGSPARAPPRGLGPWPSPPPRAMGGARSCCGRPGHTSMGARPRGSPSDGRGRCGCGRCGVRRVPGRSWRAAASAPGRARARDDVRSRSARRGAPPGCGSGL